MGIIGKRRVSDFSLEAIMLGWNLAALLPDATSDRAARGYLDRLTVPARVSARFLKQLQADLLC
jgi:hypothetical protein